MVDTSWKHVGYMANANDISSNQWGINDSIRWKLVRFSVRKTILRGSMSIVFEFRNGVEKRHALLLLILAAGSQISSLPVITSRRRQRFVWVKDWLLRRDEKGAMNNIIQELRLESEEDYRKYLRINPETLDVSFSRNF